MKCSIIKEVLNKFVGYELDYNEDNDETYLEVLDAVCDYLTEIHANAVSEGNTYWRNLDDKAIDVDYEFEDGDSDD